MYGFFTFLHIIGFIVWLGWLISSAVILPMLKDQLDTEIGQKLVRRVIRISNGMTALAAIGVLISGIYRVVQMNFGDATKPFWLNYMEMAGGMIVLVGIILLAVLGRRVTKPLSPKNATPGAAVVGKRLSVYITAVVLVMLAVLSVVLVVSFKL
jgi:uncharacterized membrane protein